MLLDVVMSLNLMLHYMPVSLTCNLWSGSIHECSILTSMLPMGKQQKSQEFLDDNVYFDVHFYLEILYITIHCKNGCANVKFSCS